MKKNLFFMASIVFFIQAAEKQRLEKISMISKSHKTFIQGQQAFESIKKIWGVEGSTIDDVNNKAISHKVDKGTHTIEKILAQNIQAIPSTEIIHLITVVKDLKTGYAPITANLSSDTKVRLTEIFDIASQVYKKLIKSQEIVDQHNVSAEIIGIGTSYTNLAETFLATVANVIKEYNSRPIITPLSEELQCTAAEKKADKQIRALNAKLAVTGD